MNCSKCGRALPDNAVFCSGCGSPVESETKTDSPAAMPISARAAELFASLKQKRTRQLPCFRLFLPLSAVPFSPANGGAGAGRKKAQRAPAALLRRSSFSSFAR